VIQTHDNGNPDCTTQRVVHEDGTTGPWLSVPITSTVLPAPAPVSSGARKALLRMRSGKRHWVRVSEQPAPPGYVFVYRGADQVATLVTRDRLTFTKEQRSQST